MFSLTSWVAQLWAGSVMNKILMVLIPVFVITLGTTIVYFIDDYRYQLKENSRLTTEISTQKEINKHLEESNKREIRLSKVDLDAITDALKSQTILIEKRNQDLADIRKAAQDARKDPKQVVCVLDPGVKLALDRMRTFQFTSPNYSTNR